MQPSLPIVKHFCAERMEISKCPQLQELKCISQSTASPLKFKFKSNTHAKNFEVESMVAVNVAGACQNRVNICTLATLTHCVNGFYIIRWNLHAVWVPWCSHTGRTASRHAGACPISSTRLDRRVENICLGYICCISQWLFSRLLLHAIESPLSFPAQSPGLAPGFAPVLRRLVLFALILSIAACMRIRVAGICSVVFTLLLLPALLVPIRAPAQSPGLTAGLAPGITHAVLLHLTLTIKACLCSSRFILLPA
mmetsp:Transcript_158277/g.288575  ORF Transcript_158277/g.288575 Transcript_158277/m.288575 type:complete len:253 (+) Transcript_158277:3158-3916(+)